MLGRRCECLRARSPSSTPAISSRLALTSAVNDGRVRRRVQQRVLRSPKQVMQVLPCSGSEPSNGAAWKTCPAARRPVPPLPPLPGKHWKAESVISELVQFGTTDAGIKQEQPTPPHHDSPAPDPPALPDPDAVSHLGQTSVPTLRGVRPAGVRRPSAPDWGPTGITPETYSHAAVGTPYHAAVGSPDFAAWRAATLARLCRESDDQGGESFRRH